MLNKKTIMLFAALMITALLVWFITGTKDKDSSDETLMEVRPTMGSIKNIISSTGTILPKNRLEMKPPVNGRIDSIEVKEGDKVKIGQILAWMSSTDRAALLDAARGKGEETLKYWQESYKPIPLPAPIDGEVIVATTQPGQTVTTADAVVVLSDRLIVRAQVDETDIGKIKTDNIAIVTLDAYPDVKVKATVEHIYHESKTVNNVTIYEADLIPQEVSPLFRSGMNTTVDFIEQSSKNTLLIPVNAVHKEKTGSFVYVRRNGEKKAEKIQVTIGNSDDKNTEILSGIDANDIITVKAKKYSLPTTQTDQNPLLPFRRRR